MNKQHTQGVFSAHWSNELSSWGVFSAAVLILIMCKLVLQFLQNKHTWYDNSIKCQIPLIAILRYEIVQKIMCTYDIRVDEYHIWNWKLFFWHLREWPNAAFDWYITSFTLYCIVYPHVKHLPWRRWFLYHTSTLMWNCLLYDCTPCVNFHW